MHSESAFYLTRRIQCAQRTEIFKSVYDSHNNLLVDFFFLSELAKSFNPVRTTSFSAGRHEYSSLAQNTNRLLVIDNAAIASELVQF